MKFKLLIERFFGKDNSNWKGNDVKMRALHMRQESKKGKASNFKCKCGKQAEEWAGTGSGRFRAMCKSCHTKYDKKEINFKKKKKKKGN